MKVKVDTHHIAHGKRKDSAKCPVALALKERLVDGLCVNIDDMGNIEVWDAFDRQSYLSEHRKSVEDFVTKFDSNETVEPFAFIVPIDETHVRKR